MEKLVFSSPSFKTNDFLASKFTCDGRDTNPPLTIEKVPGEAKSLALIVDDPDAPGGTWTHWVLWDIDPNTREIKEDSVPAGAKQGLNDFRSASYGGPCPPGGTHRYFFKLYALDRELGLAPGASRSAVEKAMKGHVLAQAELMGKYARK